MRIRHETPLSRLGSGARCRFLIWLGLGIMVLGHPGTTKADEASETQVRITAAFVLNFCKFVEWPETPEPDLQLAVLGDSPSLAIFSGLSGKMVNKAVVLVRPWTGSDDAPHPQAIFLGRGQEDLPVALEKFRGLPVLTISDQEDFCAMGGMIEMSIVRGKMRFAVNQAAAEKAGLVFSSQLLKMARHIHR